MTTYRLAEEAQVLMGLHAAQYPQYTVVGLLVGRDVGESIEITRAYPLSHQAPTAPLLEFASMCIESQAAKNKLRIVGTYVANSRIDDVQLGPVHVRIANTIESQSNRACVLVLNNKELEKPHLWLKDLKRGWVRIENRLQYDDEDGNVLHRALNHVIERPSIATNPLHVVDFDEHFEQLSKDWTNSQIYALARLQA